MDQLYRKEQSSFLVRSTGSPRRVQSIFLRLATPVIVAGLVGCSADTPELQQVFPEAIPSPSSEIPSILQSSVASWNAGDLSGFMDDYLQTEELSFVGSSGLVRGADAVRAGYEASYWAPDAVRDDLRFENLEVRTLGDDHALVTGRYVLFREVESATSDSVTATGLFSLVWRWNGDRWIIIHDHSS